MKKHGILLCAFMHVACLTNDLSTMQIVNVLGVEPGSDCSFSSDNPTINSGYYDPIGADFYLLPLTLQNNLNSTNDNVVASGNSKNITPNGNTITVTSARICWFLQGTYDPSISCTQLPATQRDLVVASGYVEPGGVKSIVTLQILTKNHLKGLFGSNFEPDLLPSVGYFSAGHQDPDLGAADQSGYSLLPVNPASDARSPYWGGYPASRSATIIVRVQVLGTSSSGQKIASNWFGFPIEICVGCLAASCGSFEIATCPVTYCSGDAGLTACTNPCVGHGGNELCNPEGFCDDLTRCSFQGICSSDASICYPQHQRFIGSQMNLSSATCYPNQKFSLGSCQALDECPSASN